MRGLGRREHLRPRVVACGREVVMDVVRGMQAEGAVVVPGVVPAKAIDRRRTGLRWSRIARESLVDTSSL